MQKYSLTAISLAIATLLAGCGAGSTDDGTAVTRSKSSSQEQMSLPVVEIPDDIVRIGAQQDSTGALSASGQVYAWGSNSHGQLSLPNYGASPTPVLVAGMSSVKALGVGGYHMAAVRSDGLVFAWGNNSYGQLGTGALSASRHMPGLVPGISQVKTLSAGAAHTLAITDNGQVWGWGRSIGTSYQLSAKLVSGLSPVRSASAGTDFSLVVNTDGTVSAWGNNSYGQLGTPARNVMLAKPARIAGLDNIVAVSAGSVHGMALDSNGQVWAWGSNTYQQLGTGSIAMVSAPKRVLGLPAPADGANSIRAIVAGMQNSAVVYADGSVWIWGSNLAGQFGNGNKTSSATPVQMNGVAGVAAMAIGNGYTALLNTSGSAYGSGANGKGQLGNNSSSGAVVPVQVVGRSGVGYLDLGKSAASK